MLLSSAPAFAANCSDDRIDLRGDWGQAQFRIEVADEPQERSIGLMNRPSMPQSAGMLFVFDEPQRAQFWMRNTLIPLDMIFARPDGVVLRVHENAIPLDETTIDGGPGIKFVLEINGGLSSRLGIEAGTELRHPSILDDAVWPCDDDSQN
ncbi:MAG: DUF192 domain-containing protein [Paracoccaceae bacterium]|nr:DUF192 domain-containing protein [Paracoccaceae bacterium]